jgi:hypothetical protein
MTIEEKRAAVQTKITAFMTTADLSKVTAWQAYIELYPDDVDFGTFHAVWQHVLNPQAEAEHEALIDSLPKPEPVASSPVPPPEAKAAA